MVFLVFIPFCQRSAGAKQPAVAFPLSARCKNAGFVMESRIFFCFFWGVIFLEQDHRRRTKIICTIGPATESYGAILELAKAGMNVARINLSHGTIDKHEPKIASIQKINASGRDKVAVLLDTRGPEIRTGKADGKVMLSEGAQVEVKVDGSPTTAKSISLNYPHLASTVSKGDSIFLSDGNIELAVMSVGKKTATCKVKVGGELGSHKNVCIPGAELDLPSLSDEDKADIRRGAQLGIDFVAQSFVRSPADVIALREILRKAGSDAHIIAKIELASAVAQIDGIIAASDAVMVARGDLGVQMPIEKIPVNQKMIVRKCNAAGKPVIVATHMLESMISNPRPTRAEATDVANAVFDGVDAVMLSGETAAGKYPLKSVEMMGRICVEAEKSRFMHGAPEGLDAFAGKGTSYATARSACILADRVNADAIIVPTSGGFSARLISQQRPHADIVALTPSMRVVNKLSLVRGVHALLFKAKVKDEGTMAAAISAAQNAGLVTAGALVVATGGIPLGITGSTNTIHVERLQKA
jgi:pyruvate kinase